MSAPFVGKRVVVIGTSREDLNGCRGTAADYDREKGRYNVHLDSGQVVALKPANLEEDFQPAPAGTNGKAKPTAAGGANGSSSSSANGISSSGLWGIPWPTIGLVVMGVAWLWQMGQGSGGGGGGGLFNGESDVEYDDRDEGYLAGAVREVVTLDQFKGALAHHSDNTGLPVVVDFYSHSCGPCRMIAPAFKRFAKEFKGQAVFLKVDVNRNYEAAAACNIRGMPTFQFYLHRKKVYEFSGADERGLHHYTSNLVEKAESEGTYVGLEVTSQALRDFYQKHEPAKAAEADALAAKYALKTALLMRVSRQKYGEVPHATPRKAPGDETAAPSKRPASAAGEAGGRALGERSVEELQAELQRLKAELERRGAQEAAPTEEEEFPWTALEDVTGAVHKVLIVGGGPAGLAAATYASRAGLRPLVVAPGFGGQLLGKGVDVENYPGVVGEHATGRGLVELMRRQAQSFEARFVNSAVLNANLSSRPFQVHVNGTDRPLQAEALILACGAESRWLQVAGEHDFRGKGVSACATCDGFLFRGKDVAVIGGGDTAMEEALHLARSSRSVTVIHRRDTFRASKILADRVLNISSVRILWNSEVESFHGKDELTHLTLRKQGGKPERLDVSGAFVAIGHDPQTAFLQGQVEMDEDGYIRLRHRTATSVPGVFAAGDVADRTYRQAITASGTGAMAALDVERFLNEGR